MIHSVSNPKVKLVRRLASRSQRERTGLFVAEGEDLVAAARAAGVEAEELLVAGETATQDVLASLSTLPHPARAIGVYRRAALPSWEQRAATLALWRVSDPGNVGTLIRTADAFGASVALSSGCADPTGPKALRASAGAVFRVPLGPFDVASGRRVALVAHGGTPLGEADVGGQVVFVVGAEREGLPADVLAACDLAATITTPGAAESLNVAVAGAIALYEWSRRTATSGASSAG